jgi:NUMOD4 motif/HNH endonuclease
VTSLGGLDTEEWRPVVGWESFYRVSNLGRIRSLDRAIIRSNGTPRRYSGRQLSPARNRTTGYMFVCMKGDGRQQHAPVHRLVLLAFVGPAPDGMECRHLNGVPDDNRLPNLAWGTHTENMQDVVRHGTHWLGRLESCKRGHPLSPANTMPSAAKRGHRGCLACHNALNVVWKRMGPRRHTADVGAWDALMQAESDRRLAEILARDGGPRRGVIDVNACLALYEQGHGAYVIAREVKSTRKRVVAALRRGGVRIRSNVETKAMQRSAAAEGIPRAGLL